MPMLIVISGLPGTGKTTVADAIAEALANPVFNKDQVEASLWRNGVTADHDSWRVAEDLLSTLAHEQLARNQSAILDTVARTQSSRDEWRSIAQACDAEFKPVECICSDRQLHRSRIEGRVRGIPGWYELTWEDVERARSRFEPWDRERLIVDAANPLEGNVATALAYIDG